MSRAIFIKNQALVAINFMHMVIFSAISIFLPLYLLEKGFGLESIGLMLSILPIVSLIVRTIFAMIADMIGNRLVFLVESSGMTLAIAVYSIANSPIAFSIGKLFEGVGHAAYWAVIRTESYKASPKQEERFASYMEGLRSLGHATGQIIIGAVIFYLGFAQAWLLLLAFGILLVMAAFKIKNNVTKNSDGLSIKSFWKMFWVKRSRNFWEVSIIMGLATAFFAGTTFFLYPLYLKQLGFSTLYIGVLLAAYNIFYGATMLVSTKKNVGIGRIIIGSILFGALPFLFMNQMNAINAAIILALLAIGEGLAANLFERMIARITKASTNVSTDIAVLHFPYRIMEFILLAGLGFLVSSYGFYVSFIGVGIIVAIYAIFAGRFLITNQQQTTL